MIFYHKGEQYNVPMEWLDTQLDVVRADERTKVLNLAAKVLASHTECGNCDIDECDEDKCSFAGCVAKWRESLEERLRNNES